MTAGFQRYRRLFLSVDLQHSPLASLSTARVPDVIQSVLGPTPIISRPPASLLPLIAVTSTPRLTTSTARTPGRSAS